MKRVYDVLLNSVLVGHLAESDDEKISFRFDSNYIRMPARPVLSQSFEDNLRKIYRGKGIGELPPFFVNLTPEEGALRELIEKNLTETDDLSVLEAVGLDLPGAVIVKPSSSSSVNDFSEVEDDDSNSHEIDENGEDLNLRFSLAGVQLKFSVSRERERLTIPAHGRGGEWIVKLDSRRFPQIVRNEFVMMQWAKAAGFDVPECDLSKADILPPELRRFAPEASNVFIIRRYDRKGEQRIHQEDFAQVVSQVPRLKYKHITYEKLAVLVRNIAGETAYDEFIRRLTFVIASGNTDAHLKNWSLIYPDAVNARLSPLYDQVFTLAWEDEIGSELALKFAGFNFIRQVNEETFVRLAQKANADTNQTISLMHETLERISDAWNKIEAKDSLPKTHLEALKSYWNRSALLRRFT